jgi:hypothetical protein
MVFAATVSSAPSGIGLIGQYGIASDDFDDARSNRELGVDDRVLNQEPTPLCFAKPVSISRVEGVNSVVDRASVYRYTEPAFNLRPQIDLWVLHCICEVSGNDSIPKRSVSQYRRQQPPISINMLPVDNMVSGFVYITGFFKRDVFIDRMNLNIEFDSNSILLP